jgi:hypothetical protein
MKSKKEAWHPRPGDAKVTSALQGPGSSAFGFSLANPAVKIEGSQTRPTELNARLLVDIRL